MRVIKSLTILFFFITAYSSYGDCQYLVASGFSPNEAEYVSIDSYNGVIYVAFAEVKDWDGDGYKDFNRGRASVMKYQSGSWSYVGSAGFSNSHVDYIELKIDQSSGTPYVCFVDKDDNNKITVMKYDSTWQKLPDTGYSFPGNSNSWAQSTNLKPFFDIYNGIPYVALINSSDNHGYLIKYEGGSWQAVGTADFSGELIQFLSLTIYNGTPYVAYQAQGAEIGVIVKKFNGSNWETVGDKITSSTFTYWTSLYVYNGIPYLAYDESISKTVNGPVVRKYEGGTWQIIGSKYFSGNGATFIQIKVVNGIPYVAYRDTENNNKATVKKYVSGSWQAVGAIGFTDSIAEYISFIMINNIPYVAIRDWSKNKKASVLKYE